MGRKTFEARRARLIATGALAGLLSNPLAAQLVPPPVLGAERQPPERAPLPEDKARAQDFEFRLPPLPSLLEQRRLASSLRVFVRAFRFTGNTAFSEAELRALVAHYEGRELDNFELEEARLRLSEHYVKHGYVNSGALLPDQDVDAGVVTFQIVEGRLAEVLITGRNRFAPRFIAARVSPPPDAPLRIGELQQRIQILLQNPLIERANAELGPGDRQGEAILRLDVTEAPPFEAGYRFSNSRSPSIGSYLHEVRASARNLFGRGIAVALRAGTTKGLGEYSAVLTAPLTAADTTFTLRYDRNKAVVIEQLFAPLQIASRFDTVEAGVAQPIYRTPDEEVSVAAYYSERDTETSLLGQPFSFVPGVAGAESRINAARLAAEWFRRSEVQVLAARFWVKGGLDADGATINPGLPDARFVTRFLQFQWVRRLASAGNQLVLRFDAQRSNGALLPAEKFALGGAESVRGYRENRLVKDEGHFASVEYRHPVARWTPAFLGGRSEDGAIQILAFADVGKAYDSQEVQTRLNKLRSIGVGVRWDATPGVFARLYYAKAQTKFIVPDPDPQDRGLHFLVNFSKAF